MMTILKWAAFFTLAGFAQQGFSQSCSNMQLQVNQTSFDLAASQTVNPTIVVKANTNPGGCDFFITFGYGLGTSFNNRGLRNFLSVWPIQFSKDAAGTHVLKRLPDVTSLNDVLHGTLEAGSNDRQVSLNYWGILDMSNPWYPAGNYQDIFIVTLYRGSPFSSHVAVDTRVIHYQYRAGKRVDISIVPTGGSFDINSTSETLNFGALTSGATRSADAIIKYNAGYILRASSAHNGQLKHETLSQFISYAIKFNGVTYNLSGSSSSPVQIAREFGQSPPSGLTIPVAVTVGSVVGKQGGVYKDTITLTVQSAE